MSRTRSLCFQAVATCLFVACLLAACDDNSLRAFEPRPPMASGGSAGRSPEVDAGAGLGATTSTPDAGAGAGAEGLISPLLIDDFEDGDIRAIKPFGWWYPVNDGSGTQGFGIEPVNQSMASIYALRSHGSGFSSWGSAVGVDLVGDAVPLDLRGYDKLCFQARVEPGSSTLIQVHLLRSGQHYIREVSLSETWTRYCLPLVDFLSPTRDSLVPSELIALQFFFTPLEPFLFWLDDVEFERG